MIAAEKKPREIWVEFGSNPSPLLHSFATIVPVFFFIYFVLFTEWGMGGGGRGVRYETEEKEASPSSGEKNS